MKALIILSGGQDSTTCAAIARQQFEEVHAVTFNYGQRHKIEIESAIEVAKLLNLDSHEIIDLGKILIGSSPLVSDRPVGQYESADDLPGGIEPTFVPGRNLLFLTIAANRFAALGVKNLFIGVCEADYGGYPDCRQTFIGFAAKTIGDGFYGNPESFIIHTPLMRLTKAQSVSLAYEVMGDRFNAIMGATHTCYNGIKGGCGKCHACILRDKGFKESGLKDPLLDVRKRVEQ